MTAALIVSVLWGPAQGTRAVVPPGGTLTIGRAAGCGLALAHDAGLADAHVELRWDGAAGAARHVAGMSHKTWLMGQELGEAPLGHEAWLRVGGTDLFAAIEHHTPARPPPDAATVAAAEPVLAAIAGLPGPVYALLDASRGERIRVLLRESRAPSRSLYDGISGDALAEAAPYLVEASADPTLLRALIVEGWGRRWGVLLTAPRSLAAAEVRRHLRKHLKVQVEGAAAPMYFRYYDPEVLREFLPTCTPRECEELLGPLTWHVVDEPARALRAFAVKSP